MAGYITRRVGATVLVVFIVSMITFILVRVVLGDPVQMILGGQASTATAAQMQALRHQLHLDQPLTSQFAGWITGIVTGHLGQSFLRPESVSRLILDAAPVTIELTVLALVLAVILGTVVGVLGALRPNSWVDGVTSGFSILGLSIPNFFLGVLFIYAFAFIIPILPAGGYVPITSGIGPNLRDMILPSLTLATAYVGIFARFTRSLMIRILGEDYILRAVASGVRPSAVVMRHGLRNAAIPLMTTVGLNAAGLVGGAVVTETVFSLPGVGTLLTTSILGRDLPVVQALVLFITAGVAVINLLVDLLYGLADPRAKVS